MLFRSDCVDALVWRGGLLNTLGRPQEGLHSLERALALKPDNAEGHYNCGVIYQGLLRYEEALRHYESARALKVTADTLNNLGLVLSQFERDAEALECYRQAMAMKPSPLTQLNVALVQLKGGNYIEGWREYQGRWEATDIMRDAKPAYSQPQWTGAEQIGRAHV